MLEQMKNDCLSYEQSICSTSKRTLDRKTKLIASVFEVRIIDELPRNEAGKILYSKFNDI